jgi:hypothetical protein
MAERGSADAAGVGMVAGAAALTGSAAGAVAAG